MPNDKLNIDSLTLDDVLGEGVDVTQDVTDVEETQPPEIEEVKNTNPEEGGDRGDEDADVDDHQPEQEETSVEDAVEEEEDVVEESSVALEIAKTLGIEMDGEYEDSVEGLTNFVKDLTQNTAEEQLETLFQKFPDVQQHLDYVMAGGESREFFQKQGQRVDYKSIEVKEDDLNMQRAVLAQYLQNRGHDQEFIQDTIDTYEDSGRLFNNATKAKGHLARFQEEEQTKMMETQKEQHKQQEEEQKQFWGEVANTIESGNEFAGVRIPDREKSKFFDYISDPVGDGGETQRDLDYQEAGTDIKLAIDYMLYSGFDLNGVIEKKAKTQAAKNLRNRIVSNEERVKSARKQQSRSTNVDFDNLDLGSILQ